MNAKGLSSTKVGHAAAKKRRLLAIQKLVRRLTTKGSTREGTWNQFNGSNSRYHLSAEEVQTLIAAARSTRDRAIIRMFAETGIRRFELASLRSTDIQLEIGQILIRAGKGSKLRIIPITEALKRELEQVLGSHEGGPLFMSQNGGHLSLRQINRIVARIGNLAGIASPNPHQRHITCHLFRHTFARLWKDAGGSIETLSSVLGHASQATTMDLYGRESLRDVRLNYIKTMKQLSNSHRNGGRDEGVSFDRAGRHAAGSVQQENLESQ